MPLILIGPLSVSIITGLLALLISIMDKIVNNYGEVKLDINGGQKVLTVSGGSTLLSTLAEQKIFIPSACGGKGTCGTCKVTVTTDIGPHAATETPLLTGKEIKENVRLSCQVKVKKDLSIQIPEDLFAIRRFKTTVESIVDLTHDIKEVYLKLDDPPEVNFKAGQYAQFIIPPYGKIKESTQRAYSMNSTPQDKNRLGFLIRLVPGGIATTYVHTLLKTGDKLEVIAPVGQFRLHESGAIMLCIAGGSGMAPLHSIIFDLVNRGVTDRQVWYFFGARNKKELFYFERFQELEQKWSNFHFIAALSEPLPDDNWKGDVGLITDVLDSYLKDKIKPDFPKEGYLCGSPGMIDACIRVLKAHDVTDENIFYDKF
ncbi:MAG: 2Fe-2S iron-sulfur cluster binding domain-containing protein [Spirochaetales bacterium]|nr:2Fe-2S iron-sulfur cluster binding domain-containing protein [Spirochaetales bacterium]